MKSLWNLYTENIFFLDGSVVKYTSKNLNFLLKKSIKIVKRKHLLFFYSKKKITIKKTFEQYFWIIQTIFANYFKIRLKIPFGGYYVIYQTYSFSLTGTIKGVKFEIFNDSLLRLTFNNEDLYTTAVIISSFCYILYGKLNNNALMKIKILPQNFEIKENCLEKITFFYFLKILKNSTKVELWETDPIHSRFRQWSLYLVPGNRRVW